MKTEDVSLLATSSQGEAGFGSRSGSDGIHPADPASPLPGQTCPTCERRVPHPKKASSPKTATVSYRAPIDELEAHRETLETVAVYLGVRERPHHIFWTVVYALARVLQDPEMKDVAARGGW